MPFQFGLFIIFCFLSACTSDNNCPADSTCSADNACECNTGFIDFIKSSDECIGKLLQSFITNAIVYHLEQSWSQVQKLQTIDQCMKPGLFHSREFHMTPLKWKSPTCILNKEYSKVF